MVPANIQSPSSVLSHPLSNSTLPLARWERKQKAGEIKSYYDRFITPSHNKSRSLFSLNTPSRGRGTEERDSNNHGCFDEHLARSLLETDLSAKILTCKQKVPVPSSFSNDDLRVLYTANKTSINPKLPHRHIPSSAERVLDAPNLENDYYLNLLDWSCDNSIAIALQSDVYLWSSETGRIDHLFELPENVTVCSVSWMHDGTHLAVGLSNSKIALWNIELKKQVRAMTGHASRVGTLAWRDWMLTSGSRDSNILNHDVRIAHHHLSTLKAHVQEVCGLKWSPDGSQLASGANDNICCIWDKDNSSEPIFTLDEARAAVKALAWSPHDRNLLATGSGTSDRCIRFYSTQSGMLQNSIDTHSQVCSLLWSKFDREIVSSHGFQHNQLTVWKTPSMTKVIDLHGHTARVLHTAMSPDGTTIASAAPDETVRFWKVFESPKISKKRYEEASVLRPTIR